MMRIYGRRFVSRRMRWIPLAALLAACAASPEAEPVPPSSDGSASTAAVPLEGTQWELVELEGQAVRPAEGWVRPTIRFDAGEMQAMGTTGCNSFGGPYQREGDRLRMGPLATTRRACPGSMQPEQAFSRALDSTDRFEIRDGRLTLYAAGRAVARFQPAGPG